MEDFKVDPAKYAGLSPEEADRQIAEDERKHINADPRTKAALAGMEARQAQERAEEERAATQARNREERELAEELERVRKDRLSFHRAKRPGLSEADFNRDIWPALRRDFLSGRPDAVDRERVEKSASIF